MDLRVIGWDGINWIDVVHDRDSGGLLWTRYWSSRFHKMRGSSWVAAQLAASQEGLSSMSEWVKECVLWSSLFLNCLRYHSISSMLNVNKSKYWKRL
jgi:hypothetical protein